MRWLGIGLATVVLGSAAAPASAQAGEPWDDAAVARSIEEGKRRLWSQWNEGQGHWTETHGQRGSRTDGPRGPNYGGVTSLCLYALLTAGENPQDPRVVKTLKWLAEVPMHGVYARGIRANVWGALGRNSPYRRHLAADVQWLMKAMYYKCPRRPDGTYPYLGPSRGKTGSEDRGNWDNSNSQIAVLGVWAGARNGIEVPRTYWRLVEKHWLKEQKPDGGWDYAIPSRCKLRDRGYGAMTAAGLATLYICFDNLHTRKFVTCRARTDTPGILRGLKWMEKNFVEYGNPGIRTNGIDAYYLYGVERVGLASGHKYFGTKDWYKRGAALLMRSQRGGGWANPIETAFALLFLARGRHPVLFNKLQYDGAWNPRPRDMANLTRWISSTFESVVTWQIINLKVPVAEWHDAPVLYVSGAAAPQFTDEDLAKLREFVDQGGLIFSEAACNAAAFNKGMRDCYVKLFGRYELRPLPPEHDVYHVHFKSVRGRLEGLSNGVRLLAIHSPADLSLPWQLNQPGTRADPFRLAANISFYVTDKGSLRSRGVSHWPSPRGLAATATVRLAVVSHPGNAACEPGALRRFAILMGNRHRVKVELSEPTALADLDAARWPVAVMTGTTSRKMPEAERGALRKYIEAGGTLIADAAGSSEPFADAFADVLGGLLPDGEYKPIPSNHALYTQSAPAIETVKFRRASRAAAGNVPRPMLRGLWLGERLAVIFSADDLTAGLLGIRRWGLKGYEPGSAFALMRNAVLFASGTKLAE